MPCHHTNDFLGSWSHALIFSWHVMEEKNLETKLKIKINK